MSKILEGKHSTTHVKVNAPIIAAAVSKNFTKKAPTEVEVTEDVTSECCRGSASDPAPRIHIITDNQGCSRRVENLQELEKTNFEAIEVSGVWRWVGSERQEHPSCCYLGSEPRRR